MTKATKKSKDKTAESKAVSQLSAAGFSGAQVAALLAIFKK